MGSKLGKMLVQVLQKQFYNRISVRNAIFLLDANFSQMKGIGYIQIRAEHFCVLQALESKMTDFFSPHWPEKSSFILSQFPAAATYVTYAHPRG